jgi:hypothetical protein
MSFKGMIVARERGIRCLVSVEMVRVVLVAALMASIAIEPAFAEGNKRIIVGVGFKSCEMWTQHRQEPVASENRAAMEIWFQGFISGLNMDSGKPEMLTAVDYAGLMAWMDKHCGANPLEAIATAAMALAMELRTRAQRN